MNISHFILGVIIPNDFHVFQRGSNHQGVQIIPVAAKPLVDDEFVDENLPDDKFVDELTYKPTSISWNERLKNYLQILDIIMNQ